LGSSTSLEPQPIGHRQAQVITETKHHVRTRTLPAYIKTDVGTTGSSVKTFGKSCLLSAAKPQANQLLAWNSSRAATTF
jgi:hypothetical protein